jgi:hypothetical protein
MVGEHLPDVLDRRVAAAEIFDREHGDRRL